MNDPNKGNKAKIYVRFCAMLAVTLLIVILPVLFNNGGDIGFYDGAPSILNDGWTYISSDGNRQKITLPVDLSTNAGETTVIETVLPDNIEPRRAICLRAAMQSVRAYLDGELIYEFGATSSRLKVPDARSAWVLFFLPEVSGGKILRMEFTSPYADYSGKISEIYCSTKASILYDLFRTYASGFLISAVLVLIGVVLLILFLFSLAAGIKYPSLLYLAFFSMTVGLWVFGESRTIQFFIGNEYFVEKLAFYAVLAIPIPFTLYLSSAYKRHTPNYPIFFFWMFIANFAISVLLEVTETVPFFCTMISEHVLLLVAAVITIAALLFEILRHHNHAARAQFVGFCILASFCLAELANVYLSTKHSASKYLRIGILLYIAYLSVIGFHRLRLTALERRESAYYQRMAFTDMVTGGNNRTAFERDSETAFIHGGEAGRWLALFDLDRLKVINDVIGHQAGDEAICLAYQCLSDAFEGVGTCYRIGGDEFACIILSADETAVNRCLEKLDECIQETQAKVAYDFGISRGVGAFDPLSDHFSTFFFEVDKKMYAEKEKRHQIPPVFA